MANWPATLPQDLFLGASIQDDESRAITTMDAGPSSMRNRFTAVTKTVKSTMVLTGAQLDTFFTFFRSTISHGSVSFTWKDPSDDSSITIRFKKKPEWRCVKSAPSPDDRLWQGELELEIQP